MKRSKIEYIAYNTSVLLISILKNKTFFNLGNKIVLYFLKCNRIIGLVGV